MGYFQFKFRRLRNTKEDKFDELVQIKNKYFFV